MSVLWRWEVFRPGPGKQFFSVKNLKDYTHDGREKCVFANPVTEMVEIEDCVTGQHLGSCEIEGA